MTAVGEREFYVVEISQKTQKIIAAVSGVLLMGVILVVFFSGFRSDEPAKNDTSTKVGQVQTEEKSKEKLAEENKAAEAKKKQKVIEIKEIKLRPTIDDHDFDIKMRNAKSFLEEGDKVKITMRFRGREMAHQEVANVVLDKVKAVLDPLGKIEQFPKFEGRQITMVIAAK